MPEGPELCHARDLIRPLVIGKSVILAEPTSNGRYGKDSSGLGIAYSSFINFNPDALTKVKEVNIKGKFMYWIFERATIFYSMFLTFGMSGQLSPKEGKHPCFKFGFNDGSFVFFNDPRHFGTVKFVDDFQLLDNKLASLGWDPLQSSVEDGLPFIKRHLSLNTKPIGQVMLDQSVFAGSGNYLRAEALYEARISPWRPSNQLSETEVRTLCTSLKDVMEASYRHQGATILTYKTAYGEEGRYSSLFKVYGKKQDPEGRPIIKETTPEGRTCHWCPDIQK